MTRSETAYAPLRLALSITLLISLLGTIAPVAAEAGAIIQVDARELPRKLLTSSITLTTGADSQVVWFPKWIPAAHGPVGPIQNIAGFTVDDAHGNAVPWLRDWADPFRFVINPTSPGEQVTIGLSYITNQASSSSRGVDSDGFPEMGVINWNTVSVYPDNVNLRNYSVRLSLILPPGWDHASALPLDHKSGDTLFFKLISFEQMIDMPLLAGKHIFSRELITTDKARYYFHAITHSADKLPKSDTILAPIVRLVEEAEELFSRTHFDEYHFLVVASDNMTGVGVEHRTSSLNIRNGKTLTTKKGLTAMGKLLSHEVIHAWCGKYRRPAGMATLNYHDPKNLDLLWVYEGLTDYLETLLSARSGIVTAEWTREALAISAGGMMDKKGRQWRSLRDTEVATHTLWGGTKSWGMLRRGADYYGEGGMAWLEFDARIREATGGEKSLDNFCAAFFGDGAVDSFLVTFDRAQLVAYLNDISPFNWDSLITERTDKTQLTYDPIGLQVAGFDVVITDSMSATWADYESRYKYLGLSLSLGFNVNSGGTISRLVPGSLADLAKLAEGTKIVAIGDRKFTSARMKEAIRLTPETGSIHLLVLTDDIYRRVQIEYDGGPKYINLAPIEGQTDWLEKILAPRAAE